MGILDIFSLKDRVAIVTGASRGLGASFSIVLAEAGVNLVILARDKTRLKETEERIKDTGLDVLSIRCDITCEEDVRNMVNAAVERFGRVDILVNNAGTASVNVPPEKTSLNEWNGVNTNITGQFLCARGVGKVMIKQKYGKIINIASISGLIINRYFHGGSNDVSKLAVVALTRALAVEWARYNINVNAVAPGYYGTEPNMKWFNSNRDIYRKVIDLIPLGRLGDIREILALIVMLASDVSNYMSGSVIVIDDGYTLW